MHTAGKMTLRQRYEYFLSEVRGEKGRSLLFLAAAGLLALLVVYPLGILFVRSLKVPEVGTFTLGHYVQVFSEPELLTTFVNTLWVGVWTVALSAVLAVPLAWGVTRTDMPFRGLVPVMVMVSFATTSFLSAVAWIILLGPRAGVLNVYLRDLLGLAQNPMNIFSVTGLVFVLATHIYPFMYFSTAAAMENMDPSLEEASDMLGASKLRTLLSTTLPLVTPGILAGGILVFLDSMALFGAPAMIGMPFQFYTMSTRIFSLFSAPPRFELAAAVAVPMIAIIVAVLALQRWYLRRRQYTTISGTASHPQRMELGRGRYLLGAYVILVLGVSILLPFATLLVVSFVKVFGMPVVWSNLTLANYVFILFESDLTRSGLGNSIFLATLAAICAGGLALVLAWIVERTEIPGREILAVLVLISFSFPGIALAVGLIFAFGGPPFKLYGSIWILLIAYTIKGTPLVFMLARSAFKQIGRELEEAAQTVGASAARALFYVDLPLVRSALTAGALTVFVIMVRELSASILLFAGDNGVIAVSIYELSEENLFPPMAALSTLVIAGGVILTVAARGFLTRAGLRA